MTENNNLIFVPANGRTVRLARLWLYNAVFALAVAGLFALPPVLLRHSFKDMEDAQRIFDIALIVHVNMSVMIWLISMCCLIFSLRSNPKFAFFSFGAAAVAILGTLLIALSPFLAKSIAYTNNYVPILGNIWFFLGLACFAAGALVQSGVCLLGFRLPRKLDGDFARSLGAYTTSFILIIAFICFTMSGHELKLDAVNFGLANAKSYYEILFWGGGHVLQFAYVQMMIFAWMWLIENISRKPAAKSWQLILIYSFAVLMAVCSPVIYFEYSAQSQEFINFFTRQMQYGLGVAPLLSMFIVLRSGISKDSPQARALIFSLLLFSAGAVIGFLIHGSNAIIPAHYHGSIVAVTLSFMALCYNLLPRLGFRRADGKLAAWQPVIYGLGQLMHITGLAIMGGYGALRKTAVSSDQINTTVGKLLFFSGGMLAIIGGFLFVVLMARAMWPGKTDK